MIALSRLPFRLGILVGISLFPLALPANSQPRLQSPPQSYVIITPNYPRPDLAPDVSYLLPYTPGQAINLPPMPLVQTVNPVPAQFFNQFPNQQFILPSNQQPQYTNQLPYQFPNQLNSLPPQYFVPTPFPNLPLFPNQTLNSNPNLGLPRQPK
jgi:hypothetical protein